MLSNFKTRIFKLSDLSWSTLAQLKKWFRPDTVRDGFTLANLADNPSLKIVEVKNSVGQTIALSLIEPCFVVNHIVNPEATSIETARGGDFMDAALARMAQAEGIRKFLIVLPSTVPSWPGEKWIRIVEREVPTIAAMQFDGVSQSPAVQLN